MFLAKRKDGNYFVEYLDETENRRKRVSTGTMNLEEAQLFLSNFIPDSIPSTGAKSLMLSKFRKEYVDFIGSNHSKNYLSSINLSFDQLTKSIKNCPLEKINLRIAQQFISVTFKRTRHGAYLYNRTLKAAFNIAVEWGYIEENPFKKVRLPKIERSAPLFISEEELTKIIAGTEKQDYKDLFFLGFHTGMKLGEMMNLKWNAVDMDSKIITVKNTEDFCTKSKKERIIPINQKLYMLLSQKIASEKDFDVNDYMFRKCKNVKLDADYASHLFKDVVRTLKMNDKIHFHTLRHSFASNLANEGVPIIVIRDLMGHADISSTQIYSHVSSESLQAAVNKLNQM